MFRRFSDAVATSREGHRSPRSGRAEASASEFGLEHMEHWTRRLVGGHSAQCLSAMTPMAMPRNNKENAGIQFGSNGTTYLHPVSRSRRINGIKFKLRLVPIFGRSAAAQQNMPRYRLMRSHQRFSVLMAKYGATTNVLQPERHSRYQYSFVDVRRNALRRRQIGVKLICSGSWTKYPEAVFVVHDWQEVLGCLLIPPSPPAEKAAGR